MNTTNWTRHLNACKIKKANQCSPSIASFFTSSHTKKHELEYKDKSVKKNKTTSSIGKCIHIFTIPILLNV